MTLAARVVQNVQEVDMAVLAIKADRAITRTELRRAIAETNVEIFKWMLYLALVIQAVTIVSVVIALRYSSGR